MFTKVGLVGEGKDPSWPTVLPRALLWKPNPMRFSIAGQAQLGATVDQVELV